MHGPTQQVGSNDGSALDYLWLLSPAALFQFIAVETDMHCTEVCLLGVMSQIEVWIYLRIAILI